MAAKNSRKSDPRPRRPDLDEIKRAAAGRWVQILTSLSGIDPGILDGKHHPCPRCQGTDRFRLIDKDEGALLCNACFNQKNGDGIATLQWLNGWDFSTTLAELSKHLGLDTPAAANQAQSAAETDLLTFLPWSLPFVAHWCRSKPGVTPEAIQAFGGRRGRYRHRYPVIAIPIWSAAPAGIPEEPVGWTMWHENGLELPIFHGKGKPPTGIKMKTLEGSGVGLIGPREVLQAIAAADIEITTTWKAEGPTDAMALWSAIPASQRAANPVFTNAHGAKETPHDEWVALLAGQAVNIIHDADVPGQQGADKWVLALVGRAASTRNLQLPGFEVVKDHGKDLRDWLNDGHTFTDLLTMAASTSPATPTDAATIAEKPDEEEDDPHALARVHLAGTRGLRYWRETFWIWGEGEVKERYEQKSEAVIQGKITATVKEEFDKVAAMKRAETKKPAKSKKVTRSIVANVINALASITAINATASFPSFELTEEGKAVERRWLAMRNGILDIDALLTGESLSSVLLPHTPNWFSSVRLPYDFDPTAAAPNWLAFLQHNLESDPLRIAILQEWAGYLLLPDTNQQKFLIMEGEGSNGKGVYCAAIEAMLGRENTSHVSIEIFGQRFALTETLYKLVNIVADVGDIDRVAEGCLKSFASGDGMFFDRKGKPGINAAPSARLIVAANNRPRFSDPSHGVWRRMILVPWRIQIDEDKRVLGMDKPAWWERSGELPGILNWAIQGLHRLREVGWFTTSPIVEQAMADYRVEVNPTRAFFMEHCRKSPGSFIACADLYKAYRDWCSENGHKPVSSTRFGTELGKAIRGVGRRLGGARGSRFWRYVGIAMAEDSWGEGADEDGDYGYQENGEAMP